MLKGEQKIKRKNLNKIKGQIENEEHFMLKELFQKKKTISFVSVKHKSDKPEDELFEKISL